MTHRIFFPIVIGVATVAAGAMIPLGAQEIPRTMAVRADTLTLSRAREFARQVSPELVAAKEAVTAAAARERQAGAFANPAFSYQREQSSGAGQTISQNIASLNQPVELFGLRRARITAAELRRKAAEARFAAAMTELDFEVTRAYASVIAADRRAALAWQATDAFSRAGRVSQSRLDEGDVSGYAHRRVRLEAARYAGLLAEAQLLRRSARLTLASLVFPPGDTLAREIALDDRLVIAPSTLIADSLFVLAARNRGELQAASFEAEAAAADARLTSRERLPIPVLTAGLKNEELAGGGTLNGFVVGVSLPLPLWDRRRGAVEAADADARRRTAEVEVVRRRIVREVGEAVEGLRAAEEQLALLRPHLGSESAAALRAAEVAYAEGEISLVEWLDAVRAYQEAEATFALLRAESLIRRAAVERAVGASLSWE